MRIIFFGSIISLLFGCNANPSLKIDNEQPCYPGDPVSKVRILVADSSILRTYTPDDTAGTVNVLYGISFVNLKGQPVHKPMQNILLLDSQKNEILKIFRKIVIDPDDIDSTTSCIPIYRHVIQFYNELDSVFAQAYVCFQCGIVDLSPTTDCLPSFANKRLKEMKLFFLKNNIYIED